MQFKVRKYTDSERALWNGFLPRCKNAHFMFHRDFMEYHSDRFSDFSLIITDEKQGKQKATLKIDLLPKKSISFPLYFEGVK